jgi:hypothetical protein
MIAPTHRPAPFLGNPSWSSLLLKVLGVRFLLSVNTWANERSCKKNRLRLSERRYGFNHESAEKLRANAYIGCRCAPKATETERRRPELQAGQLCKEKRCVCKLA